MRTNKTSENRARAARANGARSKGPVTAHGKACSSMNALKHGAYSESLLLPTEDAADLQKLREYYYRRFQPAGQPEADLVETMIASMWRLRRLARIETGLLLREFEAGEPVESTAALRHLNRNAAVVTSLDRQESKLYRHFSRAMNDLVKLGKSFPPPETEDPTPAPDSPAAAPEGNEPNEPDNVIPINAIPDPKRGRTADGRRTAPTPPAPPGSYGRESQRAA
jgi:hypothetical protein